MAAPIKVGVLGATGRTGETIVDGLVGSETKYVRDLSSLFTYPPFTKHIPSIYLNPNTTTQEVTVLTRPSSIDNDEVKALKARGLRTVALDLATGTKAEFLQALEGLDVLVSAVSYKALADQQRLLEAIKEAGIKRFVPCFWGTPAPRGEQHLLDVKFDVLDAAQAIDIPYTVINVGWWTQMPDIPGDGNVPNALSDVRDIGKYAAKIIADPRTLNKFVLSYSEVFTFNQIYDLMDEVSVESIRTPLAEAKEKLKKDPTDFSAQWALMFNQYLDSWGLRGHNTPQYAKYLGYLDVQDLYPEGVGSKPLRTLFQEVLEGKPSGIRAMK
ncbi:hypothetical protein SLS62_006539 [Diatrype stigma]|uniref:NmrA-like domain-containing protein n=1 Tax=Diatrype stigma TaxID=117547 RepID=A0AAN9UY94_9PEZI